jgi:N-carbamoyl-L-amino-acid hydrolase
MPHSAALEPDIALAERLLAELRHETAQGKGIVRDSYGPAEQTAHAIAARAAAAIGLETARDATLTSI